MTSDETEKKLLKEIRQSTIYAQGKEGKEIREIAKAKLKQHRETKKEILEKIDECEVFEVRQDLEQEGVEYHLIDKEELKGSLVSPKATGEKE